MSGMDWRKGLLIGLAVCLLVCAFIFSSQVLFKSDLWRSPTWSPDSSQFTESSNMSPVQGFVLPATRAPGEPIITPTPEPPQTLPTLRADTDIYQIQTDDTLAQIAWKYSVSVEQIMQSNNITDANTIYPGQQIIIPPASPDIDAPDFKIIPDSELVYGPVSTLFNTSDIIRQHDGYLATYQEEVDGMLVNADYIVDRVADEYSVNPRLLLAVLEYQSGWLTKKTSYVEYDYYPLGYYNPDYAGLYRQLAWAADTLNQGFYSWRNKSVSTWSLADGKTAKISATINAGTAAVQLLMSRLMNETYWHQAVTERGIIETYTTLFAYPFDLSIEPVVPDNLQQPVLQLPFEPGVNWSFTGAPHAAWGQGSAWAALDFAPPGEPQGCKASSDWVVAVADGLVTRSEFGAVTLDLDGDGMNQTGWSILYLHIATQDRVTTGSQLKAGDTIGHASCEGGIANGSHVHIARRYNGEWIPAFGKVPFNMDGWLPESTGTEYDGFLKRYDEVIEAWDSYRTDNQISR